jgi:formate/nitrite transporter
MTSTSDESSEAHHLENQISTVSAADSKQQIYYTAHPTAAWSAAVGVPSSSLSAEEHAPTEPLGNIGKKHSTVSFDCSFEDLNNNNNNNNNNNDVENQKTDPAKHESSNQSANSNPPPPVQVQVQYKATKTSKETLEAVYKTGEYKADLPLNLLMIQSFMAGIYIAMAGHLYLAVGGGVLGGALFPTGLIAVILTSAELFTGDALVFVASVLGRRVSFSKLLRNWTISWIMNFAGCLFWAGALAYGSNSLEDLGRVDFAIAVAEKKDHGPWHAIFLKAIGANFMVCVGVWQATCAEEVAGKILALWFPISAFVMLGFDHCIANQFFIPVGMMLGADITVSHMLFQALLPATLGNIVGGGVLVGAVYWYVYDTMASGKRLLADIREGLVQKSRRASMMLHSHSFASRRSTRAFHSPDAESDTKRSE